MKFDVVVESSRFLTPFLTGVFIYAWLYTAFDPNDAMGVLMIRLAIIIGSCITYIVERLSGTEDGDPQAFLFHIATYLLCVICVVCGEVHEWLIFVAYFIVPGVGYVLQTRMHLKKKTRNVLLCFNAASTTGLALALTADYWVGNGSLLELIMNILNANGSIESPRCADECFRGTLLTFWIVCTVVMWLGLLFRAGLLQQLLNTNRYTVANAEAVDKEIKATANPLFASQRTFTFPEGLIFNYFDPDNLHSFFTPYAATVFARVQYIAKLFGFQIDGSRNQAEHLLMMLTNELQESDEKIVAATTRLHSRFFGNYLKWCGRMNVRPLFSVSSDKGKTFVSHIDDIVIFLLIWGEASNLRHLPECLCFLYHRVMRDYIYKQQKLSSKNIYPGFFLDHVVMPIYEVISASFKSSCDTAQKMTYDDFNEFFWEPSCLQFEIYPFSQGERAVGDEELGQKISSVDCFDEDQHNNLSGAEASSSEPSVKFISEGLQAARKTYSEKRSWMHVLYNMHRVFEWHVLTFFLIVTYAFSVRLQWSAAYTLKISSLVLFSITLMSLLWIVLEVWTLSPSTKMSTYILNGYILRLVGTYLVMIYQAEFLHWSFRNVGSVTLPLSTANYQAVFQNENSRSLDGIGRISQDDINFYWWQYLWISLFSLIPYFIGSALSFFPEKISRILVWDNASWQALLSVYHPASQLYVGKNIHTQPSAVKRYVPYWLTLISFKMWFGYTYIVSPLCDSSINLYDDYMNFENVSSFKTCFTLFAWWFPHFLVYLIDLSIWYSVWSSGIGGFMALTDRQGAVRDTQSFRQHFMRAPAAFYAKLMPGGESDNAEPLPRNISTASLTSLVSVTKDASRKKSSLKDRSKRALFSGRSKSSADLNSFEGYQTLPDSDYMHQNDDNRATMSNFLDKRSMRWVIFARVWNTVVENLRAIDLLSNAEYDKLVFSDFARLGFQNPIYLPLYQTAACVEMTAHSFRETLVACRNETEPANKVLAIERFKSDLDVTTMEAIGECFELASCLLHKLLGKSHESDLCFILDTLWELVSNDKIYVVVSRPEKVIAIMNSLKNIAVVLNNCLEHRQNNPVLTEESLQNLRVNKNNSVQNSTIAPGSGTKQPKKVENGMRRSISTGFLSQVQDLDALDTRYAQLQPFRKEIVLNDHTRDKIREELKNLFGNVRDVLSSEQDSMNSITKEIKDRVTFITNLGSGFLGDDLTASLQIDQLARDRDFHNVIFKLQGLLSLRKTQVELVSMEASRRINFFLTSLFMEMPRVNDVRYCKEYTCLTPFYSEDVLLTRDDLMSKNSDGITTLLYLQTLYRQDWLNYIERCGIKDDTDPQEIWSPQHLLGTRMWASYRAQTLFRTVEGMMHTESVLRLVCELEQVGNEDVSTVAPLKFNYIVSCQVYGQQRKNNDQKADDIDFLLLRHPNLRVAYLDSYRATGSSEMSHYSVLIKHDNSDVPVEDKVTSKSVASSRQLRIGGYEGFNLNCKEIYRIKLPGNAILGEGKPENQNHAIIFTRGRYIQAIDMNQDGYLSEAFKMRNLLQEFDSPDHPAIVGFREHVFTGSVSSVANYMALQELSFVTLGQRVLANPLCIRQHYGHPDVFNKIYVMTEGGMSKASKGINLSEDVFAGFNATIRGHNVAFKEYLHVGKGRDVGLQQTYKFEAKLAQGNAEQSLSRDMSRICNRLDFFRLMSFFYGGIGHYLTNTMVMFTLVVVVYLMVGLAIFDLEVINGRRMAIEGVLQILLSGVGILQTLPLFVTLSVEKGITSACTDLISLILTGGPLYFVFHIQTKAYYFCQTLLAGGAMYRPTGRGFVTRHSPFDENYRFFANSHIYLGFEIAVALICFSVYSKTTQYWGLTWSLWLVVVSFLIGPFWFNPVTFEWAKIREDYIKWLRWMEESGGTSEQSWESWQKEENAFYGKLSISWKVLLVFQKTIVWTLVTIGLLGSHFFDSHEGKFRLLEILLLLTAYCLCRWILESMEKRLIYATRRFASLFLNLATICCVLYLTLKHSVYVRYFFAIYYLVAGVNFLGLLFYPSVLVVSVFRIHDYVVGHCLFAILAIMSTLQLGHLQTWLLYNNALSAGVAMEDVLKFARKNRDAVGQVRENAKGVDTEEKVAELERLIKQLVKQNLSSPDVTDTEKTPMNDRARMETYGGMAQTKQPLFGAMPAVWTREKNDTSQTGMDGARGTNFSLNEPSPAAAASFPYDSSPRSMASTATNASTTDAFQQSLGTQNSTGFSFTQPTDMPPSEKY